MPMQFKQKRAGYNKTVFLEGDNANVNGIAPFSTVSASVTNPYGVNCWKPEGKDQKFACVGWQTPFKEELKADYRQATKGYAGYARGFWNAVKERAGKGKIGSENSRILQQALAAGWASLKQTVYAAGASVDSVETYALGGKRAVDTMDK